MFRLGQGYLLGKSKPNLTNTPIAVVYIFDLNTYEKYLMHDIDNERRLD